MDRHGHSKTPTDRETAVVASVGVIASPSQGVSYYERDGYYAEDDPAHKEASAWAGKGTEELGLSGPVDPGMFKAVGVAGCGSQGWR